VADRGGVIGSSIDEELEDEDVIEERDDERLSVP